MFRIVKELKYFKINLNSQTLHSLTRLYRLKSCKRTIVKYCLVDRKHAAGLEVHIICSDATILIFNKCTSKLITILNARPSQIKRYNIEDKQVLKNAYRNICEHLNK